MAYFDDFDLGSYDFDLGGGDFYGFDSDIYRNAFDAGDLSFTGFDDYTLDVGSGFDAFDTYDYGTDAFDVGGYDLGDTSLNFGDLDDLDLTGVGLQDLDIGGFSDADLYGGAMDIENLVSQPDYWSEADLDVAASNMADPYGGGGFAAQAAQDVTGGGRTGGGLSSFLGRNAAPLLMAGLGAASTIGGLAGRPGPVRPPDRSQAPRLSPQEQAAATAMAQQRATAQGGLTSRGYAGEEGIRQRVNEQIMAALTGDTDLVSPQTTRMIQDQRRQMEDRLRQELGPGFATSTAGMNAMTNFERYAADILDREREQRLATRNAMGLDRSQFARNLEMDPFRMAQAELGTIANIANTQAGQQLQADLYNRAEEAANARQLLGAGGQFLGRAAAPWMYRAARGY